MFAKFFIDRPVFAWVIAIVLVLAGALSLRKMPVSQYPQVAQPSIAFNITYPGASAEVVEQTVTALIAELEKDFQATGLQNDVLAFLEIAHKQGWVKA